MIEKEIDAPAARRAVTLSFEQTLPRTIAHRRALGEVFVTDSAQAGADEYVVGFQIPRAHSLWGDRLCDLHDPLSVAEAARQGTFVVVHRHLGIPVGLPFSLQRYEVHVTDPEAYRDDYQRPLQGTLRYRLMNMRRDGDTLGSMSIQGEIEITGALAMTFGGDVVFLTHDDYTALREFQRARKPLKAAIPGPEVLPIDPAAVGRADKRNVVIGEPVESGSLDRASRHPLVINRQHPSYFDHDYDHVPGPLLVEGFRQTALVAACRADALPSPIAFLTGCSVTFADFGEFGAPLEFRPEVPEPSAQEVQVEIRLCQFGKEIAAGTIRLHTLPDGGGR